MALNEEEWARLEQHWADQDETNANANVLKNQGVTTQQYNADKALSEKAKVPMSVVPDVREEATRDQEIEKVNKLKDTAPSTFKQIGTSEHAYPQLKDDFDNIANFEKVLEDFSKGNLKARDVNTSGDIAFRELPKDLLSRGIGEAVDVGLSAFEDEVKESSDEISTSYKHGAELHEMGLLWNKKSLNNNLTAAEQARLDYLDQSSKSAQANDGFNPFDQAAELVGQMEQGMVEGVKRGIYTGTAVGTAAAFGGPMSSALAFAPGFGAGFMSAITEDAFKVEQGLAYQEIMGATDNHDVAVPVSVVVGILNAGLEIAGISIIGAPVKKAFTRLLVNGTIKMLEQTTMKNLLKGTAAVYGTTIAAETGTEILQEVVTFTGTEVSKSIDPEVHKKGTISELADRVLEIGWKVGQAMLVLGAPGAGIHYVSGRGQVRKAEQNEELFERVRDASENLETLDTAPDEIKAIIKDIVEKGEVDGIHIEADRFMQYFQSVGMDPLAEENKEIFESMGVSDQLQEADSRNGDIVIPLENYIKDVVRTEHHSGLAQDLRFHSGDWSANEAKTWQENNPDLMKGIQSEYDEMLSQFEETQKGDELFESIYNQLINAGMNTSSAANSAALHRARAKTLEARYGIAPETSLAMRGIKIQRVMPGAPIETTPAAIRILAEQLINPAPLKTESQLKGRSLMSFLAEQGGLQDIGGELAQRNAELWHQGKPGQTKFVNQQGMTLDEAALLARDEGYLLGLADEDVGQNALLKAIDQEMAGDPVFAERNVDREAIDLLEQREQLVDFLAQQGIHIGQATQTEVEQALSESVFSDDLDMADDAYLQRKATKPSVYDELTGEDKIAIDTFIDRMDDPEAVRERLREHAGTPWARSAMDGAKTRLAIEMLLRGEEPTFTSPMTAPSVVGSKTGIYQAIKNHGEEGAWNYLMATGLIGHPSKPENAVNSSFLNCNPSKNCATYCYATKGNYIYANSINKSELVTWAIEKDPVRAAKLVADSYKAMPEYYSDKALRLFDKGDGDVKWLPFVKELNRRKVRAHIFSKNAEFLREIPEYNIRLLSIDSSNLEMAEANPDLPVAFVYEGEKDIAWLNAHAEQVQVILPVKQGANYLPKDQIRAIPRSVRRNICPMDAGWTQAQQHWSCMNCDKDGGLGCYYGQTTKDSEITQRSLADVMGQEDFPLSLQEVIDVTKRLSIDEQEILHEKLALLLSAARADIDEGAEGIVDPGTDETTQGDGQSGTDDKTFFQSDTTTQAQRNGIGLYSQIELGVLALNKKEWKDDGTASGKQILQWVKKIQGVKATELDALGLEDFLTRTDENDKPVRLTREEVAGYIRSNGLVMKLATAVGDTAKARNQIREAYGLQWTSKEIPLESPLVTEPMRIQVEADLFEVMDRLRRHSIFVDPPGDLSFYGDSIHYFLSDWIDKRQKGGYVTLATPEEELAERQALGRMARNAFSPTTNPHAALTSATLDWPGLKDEDVLAFINANPNTRLTLGEERGMPHELIEQLNRDISIIGSENANYLERDDLYQAIAGFSDDQATEFIDLIYDDLESELWKIKVESYRAIPNKVWVDESAQVAHEIHKTGPDKFVILNSAGVQVEGEYGTLQDAEQGVIQNAVEFGELEDKGTFNSGTFWASYATSNEVLGAIDAENYREIKILLPEVRPKFRESGHSYKEQNILFFMRVWDRLIDTDVELVSIADLPKEAPNKFTSIVTAIPGVDNQTQVNNDVLIKHSVGGLRRELARFQEQLAIEKERSASVTAEADKAFGELTDLREKYLEVHQEFMRVSGERGDLYASMNVADQLIADNSDLPEDHPYTQLTTKIHDLTLYRHNTKVDLDESVKRNQDEIRAKDDYKERIIRTKNTIAQIERAQAELQAEYDGTRAVPSYYAAPESNNSGLTKDFYIRLKSNAAVSLSVMEDIKKEQRKITRAVNELVKDNQELLLKLDLPGVDPESMSHKDVISHKRKALMEYGAASKTRRRALLRNRVLTNEEVDKVDPGRTGPQTEVLTTTQDDIDTFHAIKEFTYIDDKTFDFVIAIMSMQHEFAESNKAMALTQRIWDGRTKEVLEVEKSWADRMAGHKKPIYATGKTYNLDEFQSDWDTKGKQEGFMPEGHDEKALEKEQAESFVKALEVATSWRESVLDSDGQLSLENPLVSLLNDLVKQKVHDLPATDAIPQAAYDLLEHVNPEGSVEDNLKDVFHGAIQKEAGWRINTIGKEPVRYGIPGEVGDLAVVSAQHLIRIIREDRPAALSPDEAMQILESVAEQGFTPETFAAYIEKERISRSSVEFKIGTLNAIKAWADTVAPGLMIEKMMSVNSIRVSANNALNVNIPFEDAVKLFTTQLNQAPQITAMVKHLAQREVAKWNAQKYQGMVANLPFKEDQWVTLAAKRAILDAVEGGYDYLTWPDPNTVVARWHEGSRGLYTLLYEQKMPSAVKKLLSSKVEHIVSDVGSDHFNNSNNRQGYYRVKITDKDRAKYKHGMPIYQGTEESHRGSIQFKDDETVISLFESSNLSTFLHESGHFFLESLGELAEADNANPELMQEYGSILKFLGVESRQAITREHHEKFARAFEAYLFEGKAPSVELQSAFQSFKSWLLNIYKQIMNLDVELNDEIRQVFDRMLATDEEIAAAEQVNNYQPSFTTPEQAGMTQEAFNAYIQSAEKGTKAAADELERIKLADIRRQKEREWKENKKIVHAQVEKEINQLKVYQATYFLTHGEALDGTLPPGMKPMKLNRDALIKMNGGSEVLRLLPGRGRYLTYARQGGAHPDAIAPLFGYETGQDMIDDIIETHQPRAGETRLYSRKQKIQDTTEQEMRNQFGDVYMDGRIEELAKDAIHNDQRGNFLATELRALSRRVGQPGTPANIARAIAKKTIGDLKTSQIRPGAYHLAEVRAAKAAERAILLEDWAEASIQKRHQLINHYLFREARDAQEEVDKIVDRLKRFDRPGTRRNISRDYLEQIDKLLERFDLKRSVSLKTIEKRQAFAEWVAERQAEGQEVIITPQLQALLEVADKTHYKAMKLDDLRALDDTIKNIAHLARLKQKLINSHEKRQYENVVADMVDFARDNHTWKEHPVDYMESKIKKFLQGSAEFLAEHRKLEFVFRRMDAEQIDGPFWHYLFKPIADAENIESKMQEDSVERLKEIFDIYTRKERLAFGNKVKTNLGNMPKQKILAIALNWGNQGNREALLRGEQWTPSQVEQLFDEQMTEKDWQFVQAIWEHIDSFWPQIAEMEFQLTGVRPQKVERAKIQTRFGEKEGGYYPLKSDPTRNEKSFKHAEAEATQDLFETNWLKPATKHGHTIERVGFGGQPVRLDISVISEHINNVIHDLSHRTAIIQVDRLTQDKRIQEAIIAVAGRTTYRQIRPWLQGIASDLAPLDSQLEKVVGHFRQGATIVYMGWKVTTGIVQPLGYMQTIEMIGEKYAMKGLASFYNPVRLKEKLAFVMENSIAMRNRQKTFDRDVRDTLKRMTGDTLEARMAKTYFFHIGLLDMAVAMPSWLGAYEKAMQAEGLDHDAAVAYADSIVRTSQAGGGVKDLAKIQRGGELKRMFIMFYSYFSALYNMLERRTTMTKTGVSGPGRAITSLMYLVILPSLLGEMIVGRGPDEDDEDEDKAIWAAKTIMGYPFMSVVGVRDIAQGIFGDYGYGMSPVPQAVEQSIEGFTSLDDFFDEDEEFTKWDLQNLSMWGGYMFHLPMSQLWISSEELYDTFAEGNDFSLWEFLVKRDPDE